MKEYLVIMFDEWIKYNSIDDVSIFADKAANVLNRSREEILECIDGEISHEKTISGANTSISDVER